MPSPRAWRRPAAPWRSPRRAAMRATVPASHARRLAGEYPGEDWHVDIAAAQDDADAAALLPVALLEQSCQGGGAGAFGHVVGGRVVDAHSLGDLVLADAHHPCCTFGDDRQCLRLRVPASQSIG